jgi:hypothetical protein
MMMYSSYSRQQTVRAPLTRSDLENSDYDTVFLIVELSDAIRPRSLLLLGQAAIPSPA